MREQVRPGSAGQRLALERYRQAMISRLAAALATDQTTCTSARWPPPTVPSTRSRPPTLMIGHERAARQHAWLTLWRRQLVWTVKLPECRPSAGRSPPGPSSTTERCPAGCLQPLNRQRGNARPQRGAANRPGYPRCDGVGMHHGSSGDRRAAVIRRGDADVMIVGGAVAPA